MNYINYISNLQSSNFNFESDNYGYDISVNNINNINIIYDNEYHSKIMDITEHTVSLKLNNLDQNSLKLGYILINTNDDNFKIANIEMKFGSQKILYPIMLFNVSKTNNGYKIDLDYLKELGFEHILIKLSKYHMFEILLTYQGIINNAELYYHKSISDNINGHSLIMNVSNINLVNDIFDGDIYQKDIIFDLISNNLEIICDDIDVDFKEFTLKFDNKIYQNYQLEILKNKVIINFNKYIHFSKIENIKILINFNNIRNREITIMNKAKNILKYTSGYTGLIFSLNEYKGKMYELNKLIINNNNNNNNNNNAMHNAMYIFNNLSLNSEDLYYM